MKVLSPMSRPAFGALFNDLSGTLLAAPIRRLFCRGGSAWSDPERGTTAPDSYLRCGRSGSRGFENTSVRDSRPRHLTPDVALLNSSPTPKELWEYRFPQDFRGSYITSEPLSCRKKNARKF